jgi:hypothetical protein
VMKNDVYRFFISHLIHKLSHFLYFESFFIIRAVLFEVKISFHKHFKREFQTAIDLGFYRVKCLLRDLLRLKLLYGPVDGKGNTYFTILACLLLYFGNAVEFCIIDV